MNDIYKHLDEAEEHSGLSSVYYHKMMHPVPLAPVINREAFLMKSAKDKTVLDIGCTGPMGKMLRQVAKEHHGIDVLPDVFEERYYQMDLDHSEQLPYIPDLDVIIAAEVIEHLSNAGHFLDLLREQDKTVILTTPNAHGSVTQYYAMRGIDHVNGEHVAWYSWYTLKVLVERHGFELSKWYWYKGKPGTAEGLIFCLE